MIKVWLFFGFIGSLIYIYNECIKSDTTPKKDISDPDIIITALFFLASGIVGMIMSIYKYGYNKKIKELWDDILEDIHIRQGK